MISFYLQWYAIANGLLLVSAIGAIPLLRSHPLRQLRLAQLTVGLSLLLPALILILPTHALPPVPDAIRAPLAEMAGTFGDLARPAAAPSATAPRAKLAPANPGWITVEALLTHANLLLFLLLLTIVMVRFVRLLSQARRLLATLENATPFKRLGKLRIVITPEIEVPLSTRLGGHAWVALPEAMLGRWSDLKLAVRHEVQHHRQGDTPWALLIEGILCVFFANPAAYLWRRRIHEFQELSCDEALIGRRVSAYEYGSCLVRVAEAALGSHRKLVGTTGMAGRSGNPKYFKSFLRRRIEMLTNHKTTAGRWASWITGTWGLLGLVTAAYGAQQLRTAEASDPNPGLLTTNPQIQKIAEHALTAALTRHKASLGFVVVADPNTGQVLAVANEDRMEKQAERTPHWALSLKFGPASLSKAIVAAAAVERGTTTFQEMQNCEKGKYVINGQVYQDWKPFDSLSTADTVVHSSNICGIKVGEKLGAEGVAQAFTEFGFGPGGSADSFPEARPGELPKIPTDAAGKAKYVAHASTGYDAILVSPLEIVQAFSAIANGGNLLKPQNIKGGKAQPLVVRRVLSIENAKAMQAVLADVMVHGTAMAQASKLYKLAGKTATGYSRTHVGHDTLGGDSNLAAFAGFGPLENPRVVVFVVVENPTDMKGVHGSSHAAPLFREVTEKTLVFLKVPPQSH